MREYTQRRPLWQNWTRREARELAGHLIEPDEAIRFAVFWSRQTSYNNPPDGLLIGTSRRVLLVLLTYDRRSLRVRVDREYPADLTIELERRRLRDGAWATLPDVAFRLLLWGSPPPDVTADP
jgi:hypothetical protein